MRAPLFNFTRWVPLVCLLLGVRVAEQPAHGLVLVNVGLPRTGTSSVHEVVSLLNFSSVHVAFLRSRYDVEDKMGSLLKVFRATGGGNLRKLLDRTDVFSDTPCFGIIPALNAFMPDVTLVATTRSMESWLGTMHRNPGAGGCVRMPRATTTGKAATRAAGPLYCVFFPQSRPVRCIYGASLAFRVCALASPLPAGWATSLLKLCLPHPPGNGDARV